jgi:ribosomal-protein-alanine N-acetyltransferase
MGGMTLGNVRRGVSQSATLGYWMGQPFAGRGIMTKAVRVMKVFAFEKLGLRRIEAGCIPNNIASIRVLEANGFEREGYAREYLCIAGVWQDHFLYACLNDSR